MKKLIMLLLLTGLLAACSNKPAEVRTGADVLLTDKFDLIKGKNVGLVVNHTALLKDGTHLADAVNENKDVTLKALFGPEHGVRGDTTGHVENSIDKKTGVQVYSLYGSTFSPDSKMLEGIDVLVFDIQDIGSRFYTYISTMGHIMSAAARNDIPVIVLDRPNPIGGRRVSGFVTHDTMKSFVAYGKIPVQHGMTVGELAMMYNGEGMLDEGKKADLTVISAEGWTRDKWYDQTDLKWVRTSPNMPLVETAAVYPGTCFFEGVNISEGRGTEKPFEYIGAPWADNKKVAELLNSAKLKGASFEPVEFTPVKAAQNSRNPKYFNQKCNGVFVKVTDRENFDPVEAGVYLVWAFKTANPDSFAYRGNYLDLLAGTTRMREMLDAGKEPSDITASWKNEIDEFVTVRKKYLLYN